MAQGIIDLVRLGYGTVTITAQGGQLSLLAVNATAKPDQLALLVGGGAAA